MLISESGAATGTISGGCIERAIIEKAKMMMLKKESYGELEFDTTLEEEVIIGTGTGCGGVLTVTLERLDKETDAAPLARLHEVASTRTRLCIFGAGMDAMPLIELACQLGWLVTVVDWRTSAFSSKTFPAAAQLIQSHPCEYSAKIVIQPDTAVVIMNHSYTHDYAALQWALQSCVRYIGCMGPARRTAQMLAGMDGNSTAVLRTPVGLDIGAEGPHEIAVSIVAEIIAVRANRSAGFLTNRAAPIHEQYSAGIADTVHAFESSATNRGTLRTCELMVE